MSKVESLDDFLTVKEFATAAGISTQAVYKRLDSVPDDLLKVERGKKLISRSVLPLFQKDLKPDVSQLVVDYVDKELQFKATIQRLQTQVDNHVEIETDLQRTINNLTQQVESLQNRLDIVQEGYKTALKQTAEANERLKDVDYLHLSTQKILESVLQAQNPPKLTFRARLKRFFNPGNPDTGGNPK